MRRASLIVGMLFIVGLVGCGSDDDTTTSNPLVGSWLLHSIQVNTDTPVTCPGQIDIEGYTLQCGADDALILKSDGTYTSSLDQIPTTHGTWSTLVIAGEQIIVFE